MAAKLSFEARMDGLEKVLETLKKAEDQLTSVSQAGTQANYVMDRQVKDFSQQMEYLAKTKSSVGGLFKQFTEQTQEASKILSSSHDVILKQFKAEISDYETNIKKLKDSIKDAKGELDSFRSRKNEMRQEDFILGEKTRVQTLNRREVEYAENVAQINRAKQEAYMASPVFPGMQPMLDRMGMGNMGTYGFLTSAQGIGMMAGAAALPFQGTIMANQMMAGYSNARVHDNFMKQYGAVAAQQRVRSMYEGAASGNITQAFLSNAGIGADAVMASEEQQSALAREQFLQSKTGQAVGGVAGGIGVLGGLLAAGKFGLLGTAAAGVVGGLSLPLILGGLAIGGAGYGAYKYFTTKEKSMEQMQAEKKAELMAATNEVFAPFLDRAGQQFMQEATLTGTAQRSFGIDATRRNTAALMAEGIGSLEELAPMIELMAARGQTLPGARFGVFGNRFGANSDLARREMARQAAAVGGDAVMGDTKSLFATAGFLDPNSFASRGVLSDFASAQLGNRASGATTFADAGAFAASAAGTFAGRFDSFESAQLGVQASQLMQSQNENAESLQGTMMRSALASLGIVDPRIQEVAIRQGLNDPRTRANIARASGRSIEEVNKILDSATGVVNAAVNATFTGASMQQAKEFGVDMAAFGASGGDMRFSESAARTEKGFAGLREGFVSAGPGGESSLVQETESMTDRLSAEQAKVANDINKTLQTVSEKLGTDVTQSLVNAVITGFRSMSDSVIAAGNQAVQDIDKKQFEGTKKRE
jgi:hypothetical protein